MQHIVHHPVPSNAASFAIANVSIALVRSDEKIVRIVNTYQTSRAEEGAGDCADVPGCRKSTPLAEVRRHGYVLTLGRHVGVPPPENDSEPFEDMMKRLPTQLQEQQAMSSRLGNTIAVTPEALESGAD